MGSERNPVSRLLEIHHLPGLGRDLVLRERVPAGTWVTRDPVIELEPEQCALVDRTAVGEYYLRHPTKTGWGCLALGLTSLVNHADAPNAKLSWVEDAGAGWLVGLETLRDLEAGQSITLDYDYPLWFEPVRR